MNSNHEKYIKRCYELAISAGKKGYDTFGAVLVSDGKIIEEAENTADYEKGIFGHAEFNLVHKCANKYSDHLYENAIFYTSCAPCVRCLMAIASLGIKKIVYGVSYKNFQKLLPFEEEIPNYEEILGKMNVNMEMIGPILEDEGMHTFEYWGGNYRPLEELIKEMDEIKKNNNLQKGEKIMKLRLVKACEEYRSQITDMLDEWNATGEKIIPYAIRRLDYHDFEYYCNNLEVKDESQGMVPDSTFFCLDEERNIIVGAVNIRHYLNEALLLNGGHIGDGVRPSERRKGYATAMIGLALEECKKLGIYKVLMVCYKDNIGSAKSIQNNGGILENEINVEGKMEQRYWIELEN